MFEGLEAIGAAWRAILHVSEWSGLSIGVLAGLAALVYFDPKVLKLAIVGAVMVLIGWAALMHGHSVGVADEDAKLQTISQENDARAATAASADESALVATIQAKAKAQHDKDLAEIARLSVAPGCGFDPGVDDGGLQQRLGGKIGAVNGNPEPATVAKTSGQGAAGATFRRWLHLPLVWHRSLPGQGHSSNAAPDGK